MAKKTNPLLGIRHMTPEEKMKTFNNMLADAKEGSIDEGRLLQALMQHAEDLPPKQLTRAYTIAKRTRDKGELRGRVLAHLTSLISSKQMAVGPTVAAIENLAPSNSTHTPPSPVRTLRRIDVSTSDLFDTFRTQALHVPVPAPPPHGPPDAFAQAAREALLNPDPAVEREIADSPFKEETNGTRAGRGQAVTFVNDKGKPITFINDNGEQVTRTTNAPEHQTAGPQATQRRLLERPDDIREAARNLSEAFRNQTNELKNSKPNEPGQLAQYENLISFFEQMAAGLADLADALDRAFSSATAPRPSPPEPVLLGKAADIARGLQLLMRQWLEETGTAVIDVPVRIGVLCTGIAFLHSIGADSFGAIATLGWLVRPRGEKATAKKRSNKKKSVG
jgi:hypothetical protein